MGYSEIDFAEVRLALMPLSTGLAKIEFRFAGVGSVDGEHWVSAIDGALSSTSVKVFVLDDLVVFSPTWRLS